MNIIKTLKLVIASTIGLLFLLLGLSSMMVYREDLALATWLSYLVIQVAVSHGLALLLLLMLLKWAITSTITRWNLERTTWENDLTVILQGTILMKSISTVKKYRRTLMDSKVNSSLKNMLRRTQR